MDHSAKMACRSFAVTAALFALCSVGYSLDNGKLRTSPTFSQTHDLSLSLFAPPSIYMYMCPHHRIQKALVSFIIYAIMKPGLPFALHYLCGQV